MKKPKATFEEIAKKVYEFQAWCCANGVAVVAFISRNGQIITMDHSECPTVPIDPRDSAVSKALRDLVLGEAAKAGAERAQARGEEPRILVAQLGEPVKRD